MQIKLGMIVKSHAGHDKERFYVVIRMHNDFIYIADGKRRKIESPKKKNQKHIKPTKQILDILMLTTNLKVRQSLHKYNYLLDDVEIREVF